MSKRFLGIDVGAETIKVLELLQHEQRLTLGRRRFAEHFKEPGQTLSLSQFPVLSFTFLLIPPNTFASYTALAQISLCSY